MNTYLTYQQAIDFITTDVREKLAIGFVGGQLSQGGGTENWVSNCSKLEGGDWRFSTKQSVKRRYWVADGLTYLTSCPIPKLDGRSLEDFFLQFDGLGESKAPFSAALTGYCSPSKLWGHCPDSRWNAWTDKGGSEPANLATAWDEWFELPGAVSGKVREDKTQSLQNHITAAALSLQYFRTVTH